VLLDRLLSLYMSSRVSHGVQEFTSDTADIINVFVVSTSIMVFFLHLYWLENRRKSICRVKGFLSYLEKKI